MTADVTTVAAARGRVAYAEYGDPEGAPLVLFHGTPGSRLFGAVFDDAARERNVRLLVPDRPGYGRSAPRPDRTLADTAAFVEPVLDDAGVDRARVAGFSGGGPHALALAATAPERVTGVELVSTAAPPSLHDRPTAQRLLHGLAAWTPPLLSALLRGQAWLAARGSPSLVAGQYTDDPAALDDATGRAVREEFLEAFADGTTGAVTELALLGDEWDLPLDAVDAPVRLWHGDDDENAPLEGARALARQVDGEVTVLDGADHLTALLDARDRLLDAAADPASREAVAAKGGD
ncbi:alpha/beta fold hydrolase [Halorarius halobius]|uniref:alpha/beta fold hydrolase n=1 Tax=Halorarius halobius TaxID=2962671 RepID=UPI0020CC4AFA|nr:alpha/beta hydrolase [Halorarius halobius]